MARKKVVQAENDVRTRLQQIKSWVSEAERYERQNRAYETQVLNTFENGGFIFSKIGIYIGSFPGFLENLLKAASQSQDEYVAAYIYRLVLSAEEFLSERGEGLLGLVGPAYQVYQLIFSGPIEPIYGWQKVHRMVGQTFRPDAREYLENQVREVTAGLKNDPGYLSFVVFQWRSLISYYQRASNEIPPVEGQREGNEYPVVLLVRGTGSCEQCEFFRKGNSTARATFNVILDPFRPGLQQSYSQAMAAERRDASLFEQELDSFEDGEQMEYQMRPTQPGFTYCGLDELTGKSYAWQIKNRDQTCTDFTQKVSGAKPHPCATCLSNRQPSSEFVHILERTGEAREEGKALIDTIRQSLQQQASMEYDECVSGGGFLDSQPGLLPVCEMYTLSDEGSGATRYAVGPVINVAEHCDVWNPGRNIETAITLDELHVLEARSKQAVAQRSSPPMVQGSTIPLTKRLDSMAGNAQGDVIEYSLRALGVDADNARSISSNYASRVWYTSRTEFGLQQEVTPDLLGRLAGVRTTSHAGGAGTATPQEEYPSFQVLAGPYYSHPQDGQLVLFYYGFPPYSLGFFNAGISVGTVQLENFRPQGVWTQPQGLPIVLNVQGLRVEARWL